MYENVMDNIHIRKSFCKIRAMYQIRLCKSPTFLPSNVVSQNKVVSFDFKLWKLPQYSITINYSMKNTSKVFEVKYITFKFLKILHLNLQKKKLFANFLKLKPICARCMGYTGCA